ncbi:MAG TPA: protein kinase, partial [Vicinamibacterales bacterium]|nr:protein kinase [Vicinamibacterales bacterium]
HGAEQIGDRIGLWMEFVRGRTLEELIQSGTIFRTADVINIGVELCNAVSAVHAAGLLHRDIKAQNVIRTEDGHVVLMDFGTGREFDDTLSSDLTGTPLYLAPEVLAGGAATVRSDIYSLGVLLYHLATGSYPVSGRTLRDLRRAHEGNERVALRTSRPDVRPALARVIERATDPRPERRYATVDVLARDLTALQRRPGIVRLRNGLAAAAAILLVLLAALEIRARLSGDRRGPASQLAGLLAGAPGPVEHPVIAVLPFRNLSTEPGRDLLVDSVTAGLIRQLSIIDGLQVKGQQSSFMLRDRPLDLADIGKRLDVNLAVEGDARFSDGTLLIHAALVSVPDGLRLWSDAIEQRIESEADITGVVEDVTRTIVDRLRLKLGSPQRRYDTDIETLQVYLRARAMRDARGPQARAAIPLFEEVIRRDPSYAPAQAALAATYGYLGLNYSDGSSIYLPSREAAVLAEPWARRALATDPMLAEAHASIGFVHAYALRWVDAEESFERAINLEPGNSALYGDLVLSTLLPWGRLDESLSRLETALHGDPLSLDAKRILANVQIRAGRYDDARENCLRVLEVDPDFPFVRRFLAVALLFKGERTEALALFEQLSARNRGVKGWIHAIHGRRAEAEAIAAQFAHNPDVQAAIYGLLGDRDRTFEALERLAALNPGRAASLLDLPELGLRGDTRVEAFRRKLGFPQ